MLNIWLEIDTDANWGKLFDAIKSPAIVCSDQGFASNHKCE